MSLLHDHLGGLPRAVEAHQILREIWIDDVHNSTAIEGNTMTRAQVEQLVEKQRASATLLESLEVAGYSMAADWVYQSAGDYDCVPLNIVSQVHKIAMQPLWTISPPATRDEPGAWRTGGVRVRNVRVSLPAAIPAELKDWSESTRDLGGNHPIVHAAIHHAWFERIHPFPDGNGRVGRLLLNFMLLQRKYTPAVILATQRKQYLQALAKSDDDKHGLLAEIVARAVSGTLSRFLIPGLAGEAKLVPLAALAAKGPYSAVYLRQLVLREKLRAIRHGSLWFSSRAWLNNYVNSRDPRGGRVGRGSGEKPIEKRRQPVQGRLALEGR